MNRGAPRRNTWISLDAHFGARAYRLHGDARESGTCRRASCPSPCHLGRPSPDPSAPVPHPAGSLAHEPIPPLGDPPRAARVHAPRPHHLPRRSGHEIRARLRAHRPRRAGRHRDRGQGLARPRRDAQRARARHLGPLHPPEQAVLRQLPRHRGRHRRDRRQPRGPRALDPRSRSRPRSRDARRRSQLRQLPLAPPTNARRDRQPLGRAVGPAAADRRRPRGDHRGAVAVDRRRVQAGDRAVRARQGAAAARRHPQGRRRRFLRGDTRRRDRGPRDARDRSSRVGGPRARGVQCLRAPPARPVERGAARRLRGHALLRQQPRLRGAERPAAHAHHPQRDRQGRRRHGSLARRHRRRPRSRRAPGRGRPRRPRRSPRHPARGPAQRPRRRSVHRPRRARGPRRGGVLPRGLRPPRRGPPPGGRVRGPDLRRQGRRRGDAPVHRRLRRSHHHQHRRRVPQRALPPRRRGRRREPGPARRRRQARGVPAVAHADQGLRSLQRPRPRAGRIGRRRAPGQPRRRAPRGPGARAARRRPGRRDHAPGQALRPALRRDRRRPHQHQPLHGAGVPGEPSRRVPRVPRRHRGARARRDARGHAAVVAVEDRRRRRSLHCGAESGFIPVSAARPALLLSQIEIARAPAAQDRPPLLPPPAATVGGAR